MFHPPSLPLPSPPSQLFASGYAACFIGAIGVAAKQLKVSLPKDVAIDSKVALTKADSGKLGLSVTFDVSGSGDKAQLKKIVEEAHNICPYSNATRGNEVAVRCFLGVANNQHAVWDTAAVPHREQSSGSSSGGAGEGAEPLFEHVLSCELEGPSAEQPSDGLYCTDAG